MAEKIKYSLLSGMFSQVAFLIHKKTYKTFEEE